MVFPVFWMISTAFKPNDQIVSLTPTWFPLHPTLQHFRDAIHRPFFWTDVKNSLIVVCVTVALSIVLAFLAAIALARFGFGGRKLFVVLVIGIQMLPQAGLIIPLYVVLARYHQVNALTGVIVTYMTFVLRSRSGRCAASCSGSRRSSRRLRWSTARRGSASS